MRITEIHVLQCYAQDQIRLFDRWFTTVGARQDHYSQAGTANTYRLTTLYRLPITETALRGSLGTGFKAPTIYQLFDGFSGNPNLRPEQSQGWDCGIDQPLWDGRLLLAATYFHNDFTNLIDFNPATFSFFNVGSAVAKGVELSSVWQVNDATSVTSSYTRTDTRDRATDLPLLRRPANKASVGVNRRLLNNRANVNLTGLFVGNRDDKDFTAFPATRVVVPHYFVINAAGSYDLTPRSQIFVRVDNLFNERYQEVFGFGTPPLSAYGGLAVNW